VVTVVPVDGISQDSLIPADDPYWTPHAAYDWKVSGLHFCSAVSEDSPFERAFNRVSKQAIDQSGQPGDQSLDGWWIRSQTDWTGGAGYEYMEPISEDPIPRTFNWSHGINPWSPGRLYLHRQAELAVTIPRPEGGSAPVMTSAFDLNGNLWVYVGLGQNVYRWAAVYLQTPGWTEEVLGDPYCTLASDVTSFVVASGTLLALTADNKVWKVQATPFQLFSTASSDPMRAWWAKDRLVIGLGRHLYVEPLPTVLTDLDAATPIVSQGEPSWVWVSATSGPKAIMVAGRGVYSSSISSLTIENDGSMPTMAAPYIIAEFPINERVRQITSYLGSFLLISTTAGSRLGLIDTGGSLTYGPLLRTPYLNGAFSSFDRFAWNSVEDAGEGRSGLIRFNLSEVSGETRTAWASDIRLPADGGIATGQEVLGLDSIVITAVDEDNAYVYASRPTSPTEDVGVIQTGMIRMGSTVEKAWARVGINAAPSMKGSIQASIITPEVTADAGTMTNPEYEVEWSTAHELLTGQMAALRLTLTKGAWLNPDDPAEPPAPDPEPIEPGPEPGPGEQSWGSILAYTWGGIGGLWVRWDDLGGGPGSDPTFDPYRPPDAAAPVVEALPTDTPVLESWVLRAVPTILRTELVRLQLMCQDWEIDSRGQEVGGQGLAFLRYEALADRARLGKSISLVDLNNDSEYLVIVDELSFRQTVKESRGSTFGGVVDVVARIL